MPNILYYSLALFCLVSSLLMTSALYILPKPAPLRNPRVSQYLSHDQQIPSHIFERAEQLQRLHDSLFKSILDFYGDLHLSDEDYGHVIFLKRTMPDIYPSYTTMNALAKGVLFNSSTITSKLQLNWGMVEPILKDTLLSSLTSSEPTLSPERLAYVARVFDYIQSQLYTDLEAKYRQVGYKFILMHAKLALFPTVHNVIPIIEPVLQIENELRLQLRNLVNAIKYVDCLARNNNKILPVTILLKCSPFEPENM